MPSLRCPNDPTHNRFSASAIVSETWEVNANGDCEESWSDQVESICFEGSHCFQCQEAGQEVEAIVTEDN
jgi:hypothetical protein